MTIPGHLRSRSNRKKARAVRCTAAQAGTSLWRSSNRISQWQNVLGINLQLQHLGLYSLKGLRKREYPASLFFQQPWWGTTASTTTILPA